MPTEFTVYRAGTLLIYLVDPHINVVAKVPKTALASFKK